MSPAVAYPLLITAGICAAALIFTLVAWPADRPHRDKEPRS